MDTLSSVLSFFKPQTFLSAGLSAGGDWAIRFQAHEGIKFNSVRKGNCLLQVQGDDVVYKLNPGDCFLLTSGRPFVLATDLSLPQIPSADIYDRAKIGIATCNEGHEFFLIGARFHFEAEHTGFLFGRLPAVILVSGEMDQAAILRWCIEQFTGEFHAGEPGRIVVMEHLAALMLVQVLRIQLSAAGTKSLGWLSALSSPQLGKAIEAIHTHPEGKWTVEGLARIARMSRSGFALKFKQVIGRSPLGYLTQWRMIIAREHLKAGRMSVYEIAASIGYGTESSFSAAFKKSAGQPPGQYRQKAADWQCPLS